MKEISILELMQGINDKMALITDRLNEYYNLMYSDDSNELFNEEHDGLYWHIQGWAEEKYDINQEMCSKGVTRKKLIRILKSLDDDFQFTIDLQLYYQSTQNISKKPNYIYG